jgi:multicomponent Na+:H+ antiporter subunit E
MLVSMLLAVPMGIVWMTITSSIALDSFLVGFVLSFAVLLAIRVENVQINYGRLPDQLAAFGIYTVTLTRDIWLSSVDVAKRVINFNMSLRPGIITVYTQDEDESDFTAAFSAHGITITPGELVVDFEGSHTMYVHCLDCEASAQNAPSAQTKRLKLLRRIVGRR